MGYSAQVQQSPEQQNIPTQSSGKSGPMGQFFDQMQKHSQNNQNPSAPRAPDQQMPVQQPAIAYMPQSPQIGITQDQQSGINSGAPHQSMGKGGGTITNSATSGQPRVGQPNLYPNTVGMGDNTQQQPNQAQAKGKGA
jgi:hypothetical protein